MKSTTFIAILLTLLTLLLIVGAAALFLLQGRQDMQTDALLLQSEIEGQNQTIAELQTTAAAREMALATAEAAVATRDAALAENQSVLATRETELAESESTAAAMAATLEAKEEAQAPLVEIVSPQLGAVVTTDTALQVIVVGLSVQGVKRLDLAVGTRSFEIPGNGEAYDVFNRSIPGLMPGTLVITATMTTDDSQTVQDSVRIVVRRAEPPQESNDTQGRPSAPVADLAR